MNNFIIYNTKNETLAQSADWNYIIKYVDKKRTIETVILEIDHKTKLEFPKRDDIYTIPSKEKYL